MMYSPETPATERRSCQDRRFCWGSFLTLL